MKEFISLGILIAGKLGIAMWAAKGGLGFVPGAFCYWGWTATWVGAYSEDKQSKHCLIGGLVLFGIGGLLKLLGCSYEP